MIKIKNWLFQSQGKAYNLDFAILNSFTQDISDAIFFSTRITYTLLYTKTYNQIKQINKYKLKRNEHI